MRKKKTKTVDFFIVLYIFQKNSIKIFLKLFINKYPKSTHYL